MHDLPERDLILASRTLTDTNAAALGTLTTKYEYINPKVNLIPYVHAYIMFMHALCSCIHYVRAYIMFTHTSYSRIHGTHACMPKQPLLVC